MYLKDNTNAWEMDGDGNYHLGNIRRGKKLCAQEALLTELAAAK